MRKIYYLVCVPAFLLVTGCVSFSTLQTGRTLGKNQASVTGSLSSVSGSVLDIESMQRTPMAEIQATYGLFDKLDVSAKLGLLGTTGFGAKYQFIGNRESVFAVSGGVTLGWLSISGGSSQNIIGDMGFPLYISYHPKDWLALYASPKYILRQNEYAEWDDKTENYETMSIKFHHWLGATGGVRVGKKLGFFAEFSSSRDIKFVTPYNQLSVGLSYAGFNFGKK